MVRSAHVMHAAVTISRLSAPALSLGAHRREAWRADLRTLAHHAAGDLGPVGNELLAEPHRVRCAGLLERLALSVGRNDATNKDGTRNDQPGDETQRPQNRPHMSPRCYSHTPAMPDANKRRATRIRLLKGKQKVPAASRRWVSDQSEP